MTSKERINAAMAYQPVDRIPTVVFGGAVWMLNQENLSFEDLFKMEDGGASLLLNYYDKFQSDIVWVGSGSYGLPIRAIGGQVKFDIPGAGGVITPLLTDVEQFKDLDTSNIREKLLADPGFQSLIRMANAMKNAVGGEKYIGIISGAPFSIAGMLVGVQKFMEMLFDEDEETLEPLFQFAVELCAISTNILIENGCEIPFLCDPVASGDLISPNTYHERVLPLLKSALAKIQGAEKKMLHICGNTLTRLPELVDIGIDGFSLDSVDLSEALEIARGHYAIFGNMSPFKVMKDMTADQIKEVCLENCRKADAKKGGFILMPGCDLAVGTPLENIAAMAEAAIAYMN